MGYDVITVPVRLKAGADGAEVFSECWNGIWESINRYVDPYRYSWSREYAMDGVSRAEELGDWGFHGDELRWGFPDFAGGMSRTARLWRHWFELGLAVQWENLVDLVADVDAELIGSRPDTAALVADGRAGFVVLRDAVWSADASGLFGDDHTIPLAELDSDERARLAEALIRCRCQMCAGLRPEPEVVDRTVSALADPITALPAVRRVEHMISVPPELLVALVRAGRHETAGSLSNRLLHVVRNRVAGVPGAWQLLRDALPGAQPGEVGLVLAGMVGTDPVGEHRDVLMDGLRRAFVADGPAHGAVTEMVRTIERADIREELTGDLIRLLDGAPAAPVRRRILFGLANLHRLYLNTGMDERVRDVLRREVTRGGEAGEQAARLLGRS